MEKIDLDAKKADDIAEFEQRKRERCVLQVMNCCVCKPEKPRPSIPQTPNTQSQTRNPRADDEEEKRLKRAAKRQKKKGKKKGGKGGGGVADAGGEGAAGGDDDDEEDGEGERIVGPLMPRGADSGVYVNGVTETENIKVKEVANVRIIDDDDD